MEVRWHSHLGQAGLPRARYSAATLPWRGVLVMGRTVR